jgi:aryl-alcohol dehydrogenase-like predicted oxidoreductase
MELNKIIIGAMRLGNAKSAGELIPKAIDYGFDYIDTAPLYRLENETQNSETWVGQAVSMGDYRQRVLVSTKCATSNGGLGLGDFQQQISFGVRTAEQFRQVFDQSLKRLGMAAIDFYHLWICHIKDAVKLMYE